MSEINQEKFLHDAADTVGSSDSPIAVSSSDGVVHSEFNSFGRRLDALRKNNPKTGSCTHTGWDS